MSEWVGQRVMRGRWGHDAGHVKGGGLGLGDGDGVRQVPLAQPRESPPLHIQDADGDGVRVRALLVYFTLWPWRVSVVWARMEGGWIGFEFEVGVCI
jgi:hypothetical protein